jgi:hypothetical protein
MPDLNSPDVSPYDCSVELEQGGWQCSQWTNPAVDVAEGQHSPVPSIDADEFSEYSGSDRDTEGGDTCDNNFVNGILRGADLHILQPGQASGAYNSNGQELNLFHLFFLKNYLETVCKWTNEVMVSRG